MDRKRPVIGISAYDVPVDFGQWKDMRCVLVPEGYVRSVAAAGGVPVLIPPTELAPAIIEDVDAMVFTGGSDLNPALYGQEPHPESSGFYDHRDTAELELMRAALASRGCRCSASAAACSSERGPRGDSSSTSTARPTRARRACTAPLGHRAAGNALAAVLGTDAHPLLPPSGARRVGDGLRVAATAEDGTIEAIEDPAAHYVVGVLWHPEEDAEGGGALFRALVDQATTYRRVAA
jgi:gamma-glutamyl-gamma-aminobutyrate hydrolase PuuD